MLADHTRFLGLIGWHFANQVDFPLIANQAGLTNTLYDILPLLDSQAANDSLTVKAFFSFSNAIIQIENNCHEAQCQQELEAKQCCKHENHDVEMLASHLDILAHCFDTLTLFLSSPQSKLNRKAKPKKIKVTSLVANYKTGSKATLLLLGQVNAVHKTISLADGNVSVPYEDLKKQYLSLQIYKLITTCLACLDKVLASANVDLATFYPIFSSILLSLAPQAISKESNAELANPLKGESKDPMALLLAAAV
ncbi:hypothetical protein J132_08290 [Termitomyces sp. J132]|nr:hypothetical protein J132_08290 [Termitomyces sp. J132]